MDFFNESPHPWKEDYLMMFRYWKAHKNVLKMLKARNYSVPKDFENIDFQYFRIMFEKCKHNPLLLQDLSFSASKTLNSTTTTTKTTTDNIKLPNFEDVISAILEVGNKQNPQARHLFDSNLNRWFLYLKLEKNNEIKIPQCHDHEVIILFCRKMNSALGIESITQLLKYQQLLNNKHMILILHNEKNPHDILTFAPRKKIQSLRYPNNETKHNEGEAEGEIQDSGIVEYFSLFEKTFDLMKSKNQPKFTLCSESQKSAYLKKFNFTAEQLETINLNDPVSLYFDYRKGDLCEIGDYDSTTSWVCIGTDK
jgi:DNA-directed RNA polymerase subunit H (RpoH/RPB5)